MGVVVDVAIEVAFVSSRIGLGVMHFIEIYT